MRWNKMLMGMAAAALAATPVMAQDAAVGMAHSGDVIMLNANPRLEKAAFMGVSTSPASATVREQLKLPRGMGLVVDQVEAGSPADSAGVKAHDVLHKLNDQLLVNSQQLSVLVRGMKAGDKVTLSLFRQGQQQSVAVQLGEKELPVIDQPEIKWLDHRLGNIGIDLGHAPVLPDGQAIIRAIPPIELPGPGGRAASSITTVVRSDPQYTLQLTTTDGGRRLTVRNNAGDQVFDGPVDTEEQRKAIPEELRERFEKLEKSSQARVHIEGGRLSLPPRQAPQQ